MFRARDPPIIISVFLGPFQRIRGTPHTKRPRGRALPDAFCFVEIPPYMGFSFLRLFRRSRFYTPPAPQPTRRRFCWYASVNKSKAARCRASRRSEKKGHEGITGWRTAEGRGDLLKIAFSARKPRVGFSN